MNLLRLLDRGGYFYSGILQTRDTGILGIVSDSEVYIFFVIKKV